LLAATARSALADDVGVTAARLLELEDGSYAIEADVSPLQVAALRPPVVPERFTSAGRPSYRRVGVGLVVRYQFRGSGKALEPSEVLLLPWARSAVLLTARWRDGTVHRAMFPRGPAGIRVSVAMLRPKPERSRIEVARHHVGLGLSRLSSSVVHLLLVLGLSLAAGGSLPGPLSAAGVGLGAALLARSALRADRARLWPVVLVLGLVDGLGLAFGLGPDAVVPALFGAALATSLVLVAAVAMLAGLLRYLRAPRLLPTAAGSLAFAAALSSFVSGLAPGSAGIDPADRMAAARFEFRAGSGARGPGGRPASPRSLEDPAMVFLTIEPEEVRVETLLSLGEYRRPLRLEGAHALLPVAQQGPIARRARDMVGENLEVVIDGRKGVPIFARSDFVTVSATGVATKAKPEPESLESAVLGVTLVFGVDSPPSQLDLRWSAYPYATTGVPAVWSDPTGSGRIELSEAEPVLRWQKDLSAYELPQATAVVVDPPQWPLVSITFALLTAVSMCKRWRRTALVTLFTAIALYPFARSAVPGIGWAPSHAQAAEIVDGLLTNVYRSFGLREEGAIYDRLAVSVTGDKLSEVYLESRRVLELENRGGARARVDEVEVLEVRSVRRDGEGGFMVESTWTVSGSVNHFGHVHYRRNRYDATLHLAAEDGVWKVREIEVLDERRLL
jgi:hypothetical protein